MPGERLRLGHPSLLSEGAEQCRRCRNDLCQILNAQPGAIEAAWSPEPSGELLIHVNWREREPMGVAAFARHAGETLSRRFGHLPLQVDVDDEGSRRITLRLLRDIAQVLHVELEPCGLGLVESDRERVAHCRVGGADRRHRRTRPAFANADAPGATSFSRTWNTHG